MNSIFEPFAQHAHEKELTALLPPSPAYRIIRQLTSLARGVPALEQAVEVRLAAQIEALLAGNSDFSSCLKTSEAQFRREAVLNE
jgi:hypothetical protein